MRDRGCRDGEDGAEERPGHEQPAAHVCEPEGVGREPAGEPCVEADLEEGARTDPTAPGRATLARQGDPEHGERQCLLPRHSGERPLAQADHADRQDVRDRQHQELHPS